MRGDLFLVLVFIGLYPMGLCGQPNEGRRTLKGCVVDRTNEDPLSFGVIRIEGAVDTAVADLKGCFTMTLPFDPAKGDHTLVVEYTGFIRYERRITRRDVEQGRVHRLKRMKFDADPPVMKYRKPR